MEINVLLRIHSLEEMKQLTTMLETWPTIGKLINVEKANEDLQKQAEALRAEIEELSKKRDILQNIARAVSVGPNGISNSTDSAT